MKLKPALEGIKYSIIVVTYNGIKHTVKCVESIFKHTKDFELIIVDNNSTDGTVGYLKDLQASHQNIKIALLDKNYNFGPGNNVGIQLAEGERIILLNSDTIVTPNWADQLEVCMQERPDSAIVGCVSNSSNGRQQVVKIDKDFPLDQVAPGWYQQHYKQFLEVGIIYGWCMFIKRDFLEKQEYLFDTRFTNSYEDNDLCLRAIRDGWHLYIDVGTYIHHEGQGSFRDTLGKDFFKTYMDNGKKNRELYYDKWKPKENQKLIAVYRIANCEQYIAKSMEQTSKFADEIICLFARSKDKTKEIALSFPKVKVWEEWNEDEHPFDEQAERNWLLQKAIERGADWVISIDGDEIYEDKFVENVRKYMANPNPEINGYWCNWRTIWKVEDGVEYFRADGIFGGFQNYRFHRVLPGMEIKTNDNIYNHHCGSAPQIPQENLYWLNIRVRHLGYDSEEQRWKKYKFYRKQDPRPLAKDVGNEDYHHLVDTNVMLKKYEENNRLSVMLMVLNEEDGIFQALACVESIADEYIILDNGSTDGTLEEIKRFAKYSLKPIRLIDGSGMFEKDEHGKLLNYSEARNYLKEQCNFEWILCLDGDEIFPSNDVTGLYTLMEEEIEAYLLNVVNYLKPPRSNNADENEWSMSESIRLYRNIPEIFYSGLIHESVEDTCSVRARTKRAQIYLCPIKLHHRGFLKSKDRVREKVDRYYLINKKQFEVSGEEDPRALFNMALHLMNDGDVESALSLYRKTLELQPDFWRSKQNLGFYYMGVAKKYLQECVKELPAVFRDNKKFIELADFLNKYNFDQPTVG